MFSSVRNELRRPDKRTVRKIVDLYDRFHAPEFLGIDPLITLQKFSCIDIETGALVASVLSYGRVETIISHCETLFSIMDYQPFGFTMNLTYREKMKRLKTFRHRFSSGEDIALFLEAVASIIRTHGSVEAFFTSALQMSETGIAGAMDAFSEEVRKRASAVCGDLPGYFAFLVPSPRQGSACKRMNMYLRWMIRPADGIDLGVWKSIPPSCLVIPVDTHIARIARGLGLTSRSTADWRMAEEITGMLRFIDGDDPVRFDFSLCRSGMVQARRSAA